MAKQHLSASDQLKQKMAADLEKLQVESKYPASLIPSEFGNWLGAAIRHENQRDLQCPWPIFKQLRAGLEEYNIQQIGFALNCIECKTEHQLLSGTGCSSDRYDYIQEQVYQMAKKWNEIVQGLKQVVLNKYSNSKTLHLPQTGIIING